MSAKSVGVLIVHGMGDTAADFFRELTEPLAKRLGPHWDRVAWRAVYYQPILQNFQRPIFEQMRRHVRWERLRELMLFGFSDAASLEHKKELPDSPYMRTQLTILERLDELFDELGGGTPPLVIVAQSLGGQVISNYIWDAQQPRAYAGVWSVDLDDGVLPGTPRDRFRRMQSLERLLTTGCNIPVFVAGHPSIEPIDRRKLGAGFRWINQYDPDDVLGWPLRQLSPGYATLVDDVSVNAAGDSLFQALKSVGPYSHTQYWNTEKVLDRIEASIRELLL